MERDQNPYAAPDAQVVKPGRGPGPRLTLMQLLFSFQGRASRSQYWLGWAIHFGAMIVMVLPMLLFIPSGGTQSSGPEVLPLVILFVLIIPYIWSSLAVQVKRWHDRDKSGAWVLIGMIPYIGGFWVLIECGCLPGSSRENRYGRPQV